jgi:hypothetical protein
LTESIRSASVGQGKIFYEGMMAALRSASIDFTDRVHFIEVCYCLEAGLYPMAMELQTLEEYFENIEVEDARLRDQCTMECEFCDCTRNIKLPGKPLLVSEQDFKNTGATGEQKENNVHNCTHDDNGGIDRFNDFVDIGRIKLNRKKQRVGIDGLKEVLSRSKVLENDDKGGRIRNDRSNNNHAEKTTTMATKTIIPITVTKYDGSSSKKIKPIFAGAAISGLFVIFYDGVEYFRVKNIPDNSESRSILEKAGIKNIYGSVPSIKAEALLNSMAKSNDRSNVV